MVIDSILEWIREAIRLIVASVGLAKDHSEAAVREYFRFLKRMAMPSLVMLVISAMFAFAAVASEMKALTVASVVIGGLVAVFWVLITAPFIAVGTKIAQFEFLKPTLAFLQFVAGAAFFLSLLAGLVPADSEGISKLTVAAVSLASALFVFGLTRSLLWLRIKVGVIMALMILASILPRTSGAIPGVLEKIDHFLSGCAGPTELELTEEVLRSKLLFDSEGPRYWCRPALDSDSGYRCYNRKGRDPHNNDELIGINQTIVTDATRRLEEARRQQEADEARRRAEEAARVEPPPMPQPAPPIVQPRPELPEPPTPPEPWQGAPEADIPEPVRGVVEPPVPEPAAPTLRAYIAPNAAPVHVAVAIASDSRFDVELMHRVQVAVQSGSAGSVSDRVFSESLVSDGLFDRLMAGDRSLIEPQPYAPRYLVLGRATMREATSGLTQSPVADLSVEMRIIDGQTGGQVAGRQFKHRAVGYSAGEALDTARSEVGHEIARWVSAETGGR